MVLQHTVMSVGFREAQVQVGFMPPSALLSIALLSPVQLNYTEKGVRKMAELLKTYRMALADDQVLDCFKVSVTSSSYLWRCLIVLA